MKTGLIIVVGYIILLAGCNNNTDNREAGTDSTNETTGILPFDSTGAKKWLIEAVEHAFKKNNGRWETIVTKRYNNLLTDAIALYNIGMDGEGDYDGSNKKLMQKWQQDYAIIDTHYLHFDGWVNCGQDWDEKRFKVTGDYLKTDAAAIWYRLFIKNGLETETTPLDCKRDVRVVRENDAFKIDYVKHYY